MAVRSKKNYVLVLASGGIDSTACIAFYKELKYNVECLFLSYGQSAGKQEYRAIKLITNHYKVKLTKISIDKVDKHKDGFVKGRNAFLFFTALLNFKKSNGLIACGIHAGTNYYDCSKEFIEQIDKIFDNYTEGTIKIGSPFLAFNKREIYEYSVNKKIPLELTYSCEVGHKRPCGTCKTCKDLNAIYASQK